MAGPQLHNAMPKPANNRSCRSHVSYSPAVARAYICVCVCVCVVGGSVRSPGVKRSGSAADDYRNVSGIAVQRVAQAVYSHSREVQRIYFQTAEALGSQQTALQGVVSGYLRDAVTVDEAAVW